MQRLSDRLVKLIEKMQSHPWLVSRLTSHRDATLGLVAEIAASKELAAVPYLVHGLFESTVVADASADAISQLLATASPIDVLELENEIRQNWNWVLPNRWRQLQAKDVARLLVGINTRTTVLGVLSWHSNGRVREEAVRELASVQDGSEIPFLLVRLNDWVESVRCAARSGVLQRLDNGRFAGFLSNLYLVLRLAECHRDDHSTVIMAIIRELTAPNSVDKLCAALNMRSKYVRRKCYQLTMAKDGNHRSTVVRCCVHSEDAVLRLWAARDAKSTLSLEELASALETMKQDKFMPVRRETILTLLERFPEQAPAALTDALLEPAVSMREFARFYLQKLGRSNTAQVYRDAVTSGDRLSSAIAGLGEVGGPEDAETIRTYLQSRSVRVRAAATRAIGTLAGDASIHALLQMMRDSRKRVCGEAQKALEGRLDLLSPQDLWDIFRTDTRFHVRWSVLELLDKAGTWASMPFFVEVAADTEPKFAEYAQQCILRKVNSVFTAPTPPQRDSIAASLDRSSKHVPAFVELCRKWLASRT